MGGNRWTSETRVQLEEIRQGPNRKQAKQNQVRVNKDEIQRSAPSEYLKIQLREKASQGQTWLHNFNPVRLRACRCSIANSNTHSSGVLSVSADLPCHKIHDINIRSGIELC